MTSLTLPSSDESSLNLLKRLGRGMLRLRLLEERKLQSSRGWYDEAGVRQGGLMAFVRYFWKVLEPETELVEGWPLYAICEHLEAVTFGENNRLHMNVSPGFMKSLLTDVFWPAFEWGPMNMPHLRYVAFAYSASLTERDNGRFRDLITSPEYLALWSERVSLRNKTTIKVHNSATGWKLATSVGGVGTGERADRVICDDPHNVAEAESETIRTGTVRWFQESMENRLNDLDGGAIVVIMQRVHELDVSGAILAEEGNYCHLMIPMEFELGRQSKNAIGWIDPRSEDGELAWPERFSPEALLTFKRRAYMWAGQYQQRPEPRGGGIFKRHWWNAWTDDTATKMGVKRGMLPPMSYVLAILDTAYTEKEENDPSALTILGLWHDELGYPNVMLQYAWEEGLEFNPLVEKTAKTCSDFQVDRLLIESKASGISVAQELTRRFSRSGWAIELVDPGKGDKVARAYAVTPVFEDGQMWAPGFADGTWRKWADKVIAQMGTFPKAEHDDLTDTITMGLKYLRELGLLLRTDEHMREIQERAQYRRPEAPLY